ncbi:unnamed protein product [Amoebophrya sp. A25]|nr:unnamed protein product [Amoebophrya sp. A25]|eukprot:GSA25T00026370001.1
MVWPLFPIVVYDKLRATCFSMMVLSQLLPFVFGVSSFWAFLFGPLGMGLYLRFLFEDENSRKAREQELLQKDIHSNDTGATSLVTTTSKCYSGRRAEVERIAQSIVKKDPENAKFRMFKATASNTFRHDQIDTRATKEGKLDLSSFCHVLEDTFLEGKDIKNLHPTKLPEDLSSLPTIDVEASTTFETFVDVLLGMGYMPLVVPELRTITVGGAIVGIGVESSSFKFGFFHEGLVEADILLGNGRVVTISADNEYKDLFRAVPNSLGSFGYLLRLKMRIQPIKPLVRIVKTWADSPDSLIQKLEEASAPEKGNDFVDAVALSTTGGVIVEGKFCDRDGDDDVQSQTQSKPVSDYSWRGDCFYRNLLDLEEKQVEYLKTEEYIWRWDADWFWCTQIFPGLGSRIVRYLLGPSLLRSDMYKVFNDKFTRMVPNFLLRNQELVIQDIEVPVEKSAHWIREHCRLVRSDLYGKIKLNYKDANAPRTRITNGAGDEASTSSSSTETVPIWLCPVRGTSSPLLPMAAGKLYVNFGFWDALEDSVVTKGGNASGKVNRALEAACDPNGAIKTLYSTCYYNEKEFYAKYDTQGEYQKMKAKYDPNTRSRPWFDRVRGA